MVEESNYTIIDFTRNDISCKHCGKENLHFKKEALSWNCNDGGFQWIDSKTTLFEANDTKHICLKEDIISKIEIEELEEKAKQLKKKKIIKDKVAIIEQIPSDTIEIKIDNIDAKFKVNKNFLIKTIIESD